MAAITNESVPGGTIVVGVDQTPAAAEALAWAIQEAVEEETPLTLVHGVGAALSSWVDFQTIDFRDVIDATTATGREVLTAAQAEIDRVAPAVEVHHVLRLTDPQQALLDLSADAAMLVVGSRSALAQEDSPMSSALGFVRAHAGCPVVVPRLRRNPGVGVVVLCDGSPESQSILAYAWGQADRRGLPLTVVHCLPDPPPDPFPRDIGLMDATARMEASLGPSLLGFERLLLSDLVRDMRSRWPGVDVRLVVEDAAIDQWLQRARRHADMLVVGARHARRLSELVIGAATPEEVQCVTVVLPIEDRIEPDADALRVTVARLHGCAQRLVHLGIPIDQAVAEIRSVTMNADLLAEAALAALRGWGAPLAKPWQTREVAELLVRAGATRSWP
ncbi:MAG TPA: universal stress protein [Nocardioides sp.]|nr:universal stress protein [Nocardioides sp.]